MEQFCVSDFVGRRLSEVVALVMARVTTSPFPQNSNVERFCSAERAENPHHQWQADTTLQRNARWMDCSSVSSPHGTSRSAAVTVVACCITATSHVSMSGRAVRVWLDLCALTVARTSVSDSRN